MQQKTTEKNEDLDSRSNNGDQREYTVTIETIEKDFNVEKENKLKALNTEITEIRDSKVEMSVQIDKLKG